MKLVIEEADLPKLRDETVEDLLGLLKKRTASESPKPALKGFLGDGTGRGNLSLLYAGAAARDGECCAQCGAKLNLVVDHVIPINLGGHASLDNVQLLCRKHNAIKRARKGDMNTVDAISVEAAIALVEGLGDRSVNLLKAMISLDAASGIKRDQLMDVPDFGLSFKDGRSLNGVLTGIRKRFRHLLTESERNRFDLFEYDDVQDTYSLGEGTYSSIREAFRYMDDQDGYLKNTEINQKSISFYRQGVGLILEEFRYGRRCIDAVLGLPPIKPRSESTTPQTYVEHFNFNGDWVRYDPGKLSATLLK